MGYFYKNSEPVLERVNKLPRHSGLEPESRRFESNNDLMHLLIASGFRRNDENFDFVHTPQGNGILNSDNFPEEK